MKPGTQADLRRHLESECGISVTRQAISLLVKDKDYRIVKTKLGKIKIEETAKALIDSGFGKRSEMIKRKNGKKTEPKPPPTTEEHEEDINQQGPLKITDKRDRIENHLAFHKAEKERINNEKTLKKLIGVDDVGEKSFNLFRQIREEIQSLKDRIAIKIRASETDHEAEQILQDETHRILTSIIDDYQTLDDNELKKKLVLRLIK